MVRRPKSDHHRALTFFFFKQIAHTHKATKVLTWPTHLAAHTLTQRHLTLRVHVFGQLKCVGVGEVSGGRHDGQDEAVFVAHIPHDHVSYLVLDVFGLVAYGQLGDAR